ncbi:organic cation transporter protein isoform X2 [Dendroctonus ponderosae]|uniref:Major facilitator superfamily (MFS) profile domain-containing protein n=1 Tax=Dendroctonus ponderosae TaxID=77166 RepID=A0AAR5PNV0_DENPD|nr:organic cation transporter protein isoform X2 [Dendroctonus ponderosae]XP_019762468.1 organic cation transporter protein isoform X2 [Dendroctonus ponderosae]XP_019762469.1 organic cation transporter protein isoform X2 [Dendroctonus ponderosae]XP_019762470.1 organic cation transporter protein isoform X2 [Dendroctonus ponderosae]XP_019762471.1 organic cation transporter protein isoform X2 [Dendroctonus ponderosae]
MREIYTYPEDRVTVQERLLQMPEQSTNSSKEEEEEDIISNAIGEFGRWQLLLTFILSLVNIPCTWHIFVPTFHARERDYVCIDPLGICPTSDPCWVNQLSSNGSCLVDSNSTLRCENWEFKGKGLTITSEFNLICDRKTLINLAEMMFLAGVAVGGLVSGIISDKYGRKRTLLASILVQCTLGTLIAFAPWYELYVVLRCMLGFFSVSVVFSGFVLAIELVGGHWRTITGISYLFPVALGYCTISGMAYMLDNWRYLQLAVSLPGTLFLLAWFILPESPRWLLALGRTKEVLKILEDAARFNKKELPANLDKSLVPLANLDQQENQNVGVLDLFKTAAMRQKTLILCLIWFGVYLVYYGLVLNLGNLGGDLYVNSVLIGIVEVPAVALSILILIKGGRRWPLALTMIVSGIFAALAIPVSWISNDMQWLITTFMMTSKFCISSSNAIMPVYTAELYPTIIRNIGVGAANVPAGIALMLVPYLWELTGLHKSLPLLVISIFGIVGGASVLFLPETGLQPLPDTLDGTPAAKVSASHNGEVKKINNNHCT